MVSKFTAFWTLYCKWTPRYLAHCSHSFKYSGYSVHFILEKKLIQLMMTVWNWIPSIYSGWHIILVTGCVHVVAHLSIDHIAQIQRWIYEVCAQIGRPIDCLLNCDNLFRKRVNTFGVTMHWDRLNTYLTHIWSARVLCCEVRGVGHHTHRSRKKLRRLWNA